MHHRGTIFLFDEKITKYVPLMVYNSSEKYKIEIPNVAVFHFFGFFRHRLKSWILFKDLHDGWRAIEFFNDISHFNSISKFFVSNWRTDQLM